jgi:DDE superfamily endonuclease
MSALFTLCDFTGAVCTGGLIDFATEMLLDLPRSDQRRWGAVYLEGLLSLPGRKSIRRMSETIAGGGADQGIQQFLNQSPWEWAPVRRNLARYATSILTPRAWLVTEVAVAKNGSSSVGVERQYAPSLGRVLNCQRGLGVFLAGDRGAVPVDWRLLLPPSWDTDERRRRRAHVPDDERHRSPQEYLLEMLDEMTGAWGLYQLPVVVETGTDTDPEPLARALQDRGHHYLIRMPTGVSVVHGEPVAGRRTVGGSSLAWHEGGDASTSQFVVQHLPRRPRAGAGWWRAPGQSVLSRWLPGRHRPSEVWLTDLGSLRLPQLVDVARVRHRVGADLDRLSGDFGFGHFEGRSFRGWHHHATLVSLAQAFDLGRRLSEDGGERMRPLSA